MSILQAIGNTPLVRLSHVFRGSEIEVYAKLEGCNPGGSAKDRAAKSMVEAAISRGSLRAGMTLIESSSGNMAIGMALACGDYGLRLLCVIDPRISRVTLAILRCLGVSLDLVKEPDAATMEFQPARIARARELQARLADSLWLDQYSNLDNAAGHHATMREIVGSLPRLDYLFVPVSTCGTLRGCSDYAKGHCMNCKLVAVDAVGSTIFGGSRAPRLLAGHGGAITPGLLNGAEPYLIVRVDDVESVRCCRELALKEKILAGASSGAAVAALKKTMSSIPRQSICVLIFPDRGDRYVDTVYSDEWVRSHLPALDVC